MREREGGKEGRGVRKKGVLVLEYHEGERGVRKKGVLVLEYHEGGRGVRKKGVLVLEYHEGERGGEGGERGKEERCTSTRVP